AVGWPFSCFMAFNQFGKKSLVDWAKAAGIAALAIGLRFASNAARLWPTLEYSQETIRGKSELSQKSSKGDGLDKDYLFGWSHG
ncbi:MAG: hypothetical protein IPL65_02865, partial [Lewinellaceae bacterium]|nr:hypothetical protein [Lewinellaceae bacterium]